MTTRIVQPLAPVEYQALLSHCSACTSCQSATGLACPRAAALRQQWQAAGRRFIRERRAR